MASVTEQPRGRSGPLSLIEGRVAWETEDKVLEAESHKDTSLWVGKSARWALGVSGSGRRLGGMGGCPHGGYVDMALASGAGACLPDDEHERILR